MFINHRIDLLDLLVHQKKKIKSRQTPISFFSSSKNPFKVCINFRYLLNEFRTNRNIQHHELETKQKLISPRCILKQFFMDHI